jgi:NADH:ubiquinone oxidoreductase subunit 5 (subunit L)/multisubunit Na+/H+ antiporter MnhA subunit
MQSLSIYKYIFLFLFFPFLLFSKTFLELILNFFNSIDFFFFNFNLTKLLNFNFLDYPLFLGGAFFFFLTSAFSLIFLSYLGFYGIFFINLFSLVIFFFSMLFYVKSVFILDSFYYIKLGKWMFLSNYFKVDFDFFVDNISLSFSLLTTTIAIFVYMYTFSYFRYEPLVDRLLVFLNLFIISMVFLVSSGNLVSLFLGWEMIGMTSFFLINFWALRIGTFKSAFKAFSFNKFSDLFLFFSIILIFNLTFSLDIITVLNQIQVFESLQLNFFFFTFSYLDLICVFFLLCAFIKSAQFGAHIWLPDSMEAPVPASALIHSATLVSAGIFLLLRFSPLFELSSFSFYIIGLIGSITAFYGGFSSMFQSDTKKILAYSTISHCGFLMVVYTTGVIEYVLVYLYIHGFFKAAVFMCVGNVNRLSKNNQDFKRMGMYYKYLPFDCYLTFVGLMNLSGLPFTLGFYIKHLLLISLNYNYLVYYFILVNCFFGALTGLYYSSRLFFYVFFDFKKSKKNLYLYYSTLNLNSKFYSNSSLSSNLAISLIFLFSYLLGFFFLNSYMSFNFTFSTFFSYTNLNSQIISFLPANYELFNFGFINYFVVIFIFFIVFNSWRFSNLYNKIFDIFFNLVSIIIFYFFFKSII